MKKIKGLSLIIGVLMIALFITACGNTNQIPNEASDSSVGKYTLVSYRVNGEETDISVYTSKGVYSTLQLREDGTGTFDAFGTLAEFTWDKSSLTFDDGVSTYVLDGNVMTVTDGPAVMIFKRDGIKEQPSSAGVKQGSKTDVPSDDGVKVMSIDATPIEWKITAENISFERGTAFPTRSASRSSA